jgi:hypothetical protein
MKYCGALPRVGFAVIHRQSRGPQPEPVSYWTLNDDDSAEVAADVMGKHAATGANIVWCPTGNGNCATFNGTSSDFTTSGPVLDTAPGSSFTVSANVYMTGTNAADDGFETILSAQSSLCVR